MTYTAAIDAPLQDDQMPGKILYTPREARQKSRKDFLLSSKKITKSLLNFKLNGEERSIARGLLGFGGRAERILWSDIPAKYQASKALVSVMVSQREAAPPSRTYFLISFNDDCGTTSDRIPYLAIQQTTEKIRRAIASMKLNAFVMLEVHPVINYPAGGAGRSFLLGGHAIAWSDVPFDHVATAIAFCASPAWNCTLGADPVHIKVIGRGPGEMESVAHYLIKQRPDAKNLMPSHQRPGHNLMMDTTAGYRDEFALRLFEGQSQVELMSVMFGVGDGRKVRQSIRTHVTEWHRSRQRRVTVAKDYDVWAFWTRLRERRGSRRYLPFRFDGGAFRPVVPIQTPATATQSRAPLAPTPLELKPNPELRSKPLRKRAHPRSEKRLHPALRRLLLLRKGPSS